jgi:hypothetical protein
VDLTNAGEYYPKLMVNVLSKQKSITKIKVKILPLINKWQDLLGISDWVILSEPISEDQVVDELEQNTHGHEFVGIHIDFANKIGTICHTRKLKEDDIIHELLHVRFHSWSEEKVNFWTDLLLRSPKYLFQF